MSDETSNAGGQQAAGNQDQRRVHIHRLYLKDASFESPATPDVFFTGGNFQPSVDLQLNTDSKAVGDGAHEVVLTVTVTGSTEERTAFIVEIKQAGVFGIEGFSGEELKQVLGAYCPSVLFPFAREVVADLVAKGSLPQLVLQPVNFDALYAQHVQQQGAGASDASG